MVEVGVRWCSDCNGFLLVAAVGGWGRRSRGGGEEVGDVVGVGFSKFVLRSG